MTRQGRGKHYRPLAAESRTKGTERPVIGSSSSAADDVSTNGEDEGSTARRGWGRGRHAMACAGLALGVAALAALALQGPIRQLLAQNARIADVREESSLLERQNAELERRVQELGSDSTLERLAREELGLVRPGEEVYVLVPPGSLGGVPTDPLPGHVAPETAAIE